MYNVYCILYDIPTINEMLGYIISSLYFAQIYFGPYAEKKGKWGKDGE